MTAATPAPGSAPSSGPISPVQLAVAFRAAAEAADAAAGSSAALAAALDVLYEQVDTALVAALVEEHGRLWLVGGRGYTMTPDGVLVSSGIIGRASRTGRVQYVPDLTADRDYVEVVKGVVSELAIPISIDGAVIGVINIETRAALPRQSPKLARELAAAIAPILASVRADRVLDLPALTRLSVHISSLRDSTEIVEIAASSLTRALPIETSVVCLRGESGRLAVAATSSLGSDAPSALTVAQIEELRTRAADSAVIEEIDVAAAGLPGLVAGGIRAAVVIPLRANGVELGVVVGESRWAQAIDPGQAEVASLLVAHVAASLDAAFALDRERRSALTDPLTGLLNRRGFEIALEAAIAESHAARLPLSLWILDFDDFKEVNDRAGHEFGDALLSEVGMVLGKVLPPGTSSGRLGGDEFVVLLPDTDAESAAVVAQGLRERLLGGLDDAGFPLRVSIGVATYPFDGGLASQLLRAADQALYGAKEQGKNRVVGFRELLRETAAATQPAGAQDRRATGLDTSSLVEAGEAGLALWKEHTIQGVLDRLCKALTFTIGSTGANVSRVIGPRLVDVAAHVLRDSGSLAADTSYLIDEFPVTKAALERLETASISFLDDDLDRAEAFVLRDLEMSCALLVPLAVHGEAWGLVELYDMRLRRYTRVQQSVAEFLVGVAGHRLEALGDDVVAGRRLPLFRVPDRPENV